ncbi:hypothetical protein ACVWZA_003436 [Sphingomonas sp. UYAg733]
MDEDINWPVAQVLYTFLASIGAAPANPIRHVLATDDDYWKEQVLRGIVAESADLRATFRPELERLAFDPTPREEAREISAFVRVMLLKSTGSVDELR